MWIMLLQAISVQTTSPQISWSESACDRMSDILLITETKLDNTFPVSQFSIDGFSMAYRLDRNWK